MDLPLIVIIVLLLVILGYLIFRKKDDCCEKQNTTTPAPIQNTPLFQSLIARASSSEDPESQANDQVILPHDDGVVSELVQWWYWTGHLKTDDDSIALGYEVCFFMLAEAGNLVQIGITDVTNNKFYFDEYLSTTPPDMTPNQFNLAAENNIALAHGGNGIDYIESSPTGCPYKLKLNLQQTIPTTMHYGGTRHNYSFGGNTKYYSRTVMNTTGTIIDSTIPATPVTKSISGNTWFDRQYGGLLLAISRGWQWFAIEIYDLGQVMLFDFNGNVTNELNGSFTDPVGNSFEFSNLTVTDVGPGWTSPNSNCKYPNIWKVTFPINQSGTMGTYLLMPEVANQELLVKYSPRYWEGTCNVYTYTPGNLSALQNGTGLTADNILGKAYVELNGFCPSASSTNNYISVDATNRKCYY